jgi:peptidoglycan hydrolase-like protein with peptidoglycan-binding domain
MRTTKFRILSAITAGSLALGVLAAITLGSGSGSGHTAQPPVLAAQTESFPPVNLDDCPILHTGYNGGCVAQLQTYLNSLPGNDLDVDGDFGSQTYAAVIAFQRANGLTPDGLVGPATKKALEAALSVATPTVGPPTASAPSPSPADSTASLWSPPVVTSGIVTSTIYFNKKQTDYFDSDEGQACALIEAAALPVPGAGEIGAFVAGACEVDAQVIELQAGRAEERGMCLKIKFTNTQVPILWPDIYQGQYCN